MRREYVVSPCCSHGFSSLWLSSFPAPHANIQLAPQSARLLERRGRWSSLRYQSSPRSSTRSHRPHLTHLHRHQWPNCLPFRTFGAALGRSSKERVNGVATHAFPNPFFVGKLIKKVITFIFAIVMRYKRLQKDFKARLTGCLRHQTIANLEILGGFGRQRIVSRSFLGKLLCVGIQMFTGKANISAIRQMIVCYHFHGVP